MYVKPLTSVLELYVVEAIIRTKTLTEPDPAGAVQPKLKLAPLDDIVVTGVCTLPKKILVLAVVNARVVFIFTTTLVPAEPVFGVTLFNVNV